MFLWVGTKEVLTGNAFWKQWLVWLTGLAMLELDGLGRGRTKSELKVFFCDQENRKDVKKNEESWRGASFERIEWF